MKRISPIVVIATGLVMLSCAIALMGDFFLSYFADPQAELRKQRERVANTAAVSVVDMVSQGEIERIQVLLTRTVDNDSDLLSAAIRKNDGNLLLATRKHYQYAAERQSTGDHLALASVPIDTKAGSWGQIELIFRPTQPGVIGFVKSNPSLLFFLCVAFFGFVTYALYMKRVLHQFDPNATIPERVRAAFDAMTEGVVIVDSEGRIAMANDKFSLLCEISESALTAEHLSRVSWLKERLQEDPQDHPWHRCMREQSAVVGADLLLNEMPADEQRVIVNCAPILDSHNKVRGCMVTFDNITELHLANQQLELTLHDLQNSRLEVEKKAADLQRLASVDYLTGVLNRRAFTEQASELFEVASQRRHVFSCIMIDIDHFKSINDTFGHGVGDLVIQSLADILTANTRDEDRVGRLGGEEFCIALPNTGREMAMEIAQRIRLAVENQIVNTVEQLETRVVTASVGVAVYQKHHKSLLALVESSDQALYEAKESGRNRVCLAERDTAVTD
jgi:diguanylate cyclase (GGDEF)-like protein